MSHVVILGGGVAGMSAAHMLGRKGFKVTVFEKQSEYVGGKARSLDVPDTANPDTGLSLPGEHGFRFFPGFYRHITKTMKEIPMGDDQSAFDSLVSTETIAIYQAHYPTIEIPLNFPTSVEDLEAFFKAFLQAVHQLEPGELSFFSMRIWQLMTSCEERYFDEYESLGWWEYLEADNFSEAYQKLLVEGLTRSLVAAQAELASTRTIGAVLLQLIYDIINPRKKNADQVLNAPTNDAWLNPWLSYLTDELGVEFHKGYSLAGINMSNDTVGSAIGSVIVQNEKDGTPLPPITADYYLIATPVEVFAPFIEGDLLAADPSLGSIVELAENTEWMNGIQFYLTEEYPMHHGHTLYADSNWALTSISQIQFWEDYDLDQRFNGLVKGILSVDISDWSKPGNFNGKPARECTRLEVIKETWKQLKREINGPGQKNLLTNDMLLFVYLDEDIYEPYPNPRYQQELSRMRFKQEDGLKISELENKEPLLVNLINTWSLRPNAYTGVPNLFLASDYVKTFTDLATMEGANEAARRAVNSILDASGSDAKREKVWPYKTPKSLNKPRKKDYKRWKAGLPWENPRS